MKAVDGSSWKISQSRRWEEEIECVKNGFISMTMTNMEDLKCNITQWK